MKSFDPLLTQTITDARRLLLTSHVHPDGDAAGSVIGLARSLRQIGKMIDIAWSTSVEGRFDFLFQGEPVLTPETIRPPYDAVIILDIGSEDRTGFQDIIRELGCPIINIDHHATNEGFCRIDHVDMTASSTCEIVLHLIRTAGWPLDIPVAEALYTGLVTDSRHFQNAGVTQETFEAAAVLKSTGLNTEPIIQVLVQGRSETDLRVLGFALSHFESVADGRIACAMLSQPDLELLGANHRHVWTAGVFSYLISLAQAIVSVTLVEAENGRVYCEFRSKNGFDVSEIATEFGGGGHRAASGCSQEIPISEFRDAVLNRLLPRIEAFTGASDRS
ncbi:bifunctional oligoribonuclease/PAP phosphatase NrnA [bacterium]|nr:bifunctional oligoribonuclease/PAP phosphatase NrnA [candidate division CSSED10-310 bacterium]